MVLATASSNGNSPSPELLRTAGDTVEGPAPPKLDDILSLFADYRTFYKGFHGECERADTYYFGLNPVPVPANADVVRPATPRAIVNVATDHVDVNNLSIDVPLASQRAKARAERLKKFYQGAWASIKTPVKRTAVNHAFRYGIAWLKQMWASELWPDAPPMEEFGDPDSDDFDEAGYKAALANWQERRDIVFPFHMENVNPQNLLWDDSRARCKWVIEVHTATVGDVRRRYPEWLSARTGQDIVTWMEYWDDTWYGYIADNAWVKEPQQHGYGFMPYIPVIPARSGDFQVGRPENRYQSILAPVYSLMDTEARLMSQYEAIVRKYAWPTLNFKGPRASAEADRDAYEQFGALNVISPNVEVETSPVATPPQEILALLSMVQNEIEMATFPNVVRGMRPKGVSSGFGVSVLAGMGRLVFQDVADGMSRAIERLNSGFAMLVENKARGAITVHARTDVHDFDQTIGPDDVRGYYENVVSLKAEAPEERERESLLAFRLWNGGQGVLSLEETMRRCGIVNPLEEQNQIATEALLRELLPTQLQKAIERLAASQAGQQATLAGGGGGLGTQFLPGQAQLPRPGEAAIQRRRVATRAANPNVFPKGLSGLDRLGAQLGVPMGGGARMPSGEMVP